MTNYFFSATENCFYSIQLKNDYLSAGTWPSDAVGITDQMYEEFILPCPNKERIANASGFPSWRVVEEDSLPSRIKRKKSQMSKASDNISILNNLADLGMADEKDKKDLLSWRIYQALLYKFDPEDPGAEFPAPPK